MKLEWPQNLAFEQAMQEEVLEAISYWSLTDVRVFQPGGFTAYSARVTHPQIGECVLRVGASERESLALTLWSGEGAVRLLETRAKAQILESLGSSVRAASDTEQRRAFLDLHKLWVRSPSELPLLEDVVSEWDLPKEVRGVWEKLLMKRERFLLHGDLNEDNILRSESGWKAIDPDPVVGDPCYDVEPLLRRYLDQDNLEGLKRLLDLTPDRERVLDWAWVRNHRYHSLSEGERQRVWEKRLAAIDAVRFRY